MSAHDQLVEMMENYIAENKKFTDKKVKAAATRARAALQEIGKAVKEKKFSIDEVMKHRVFPSDEIPKPECVLYFHDQMVMTRKG